VDYGNPISYMALDSGTAVVSSDGTRVGTVEHVLADEDNDIFDGLVIDLQSGPGGLHFADSEQVGDIYERAVMLTVPASDVEQLPKPGPSPAVMEHHGSEDSESPLERKLRRAWDMISGKY
jgi:sporulation protein YlmC with PRC-barrel domain